ncbi:MAG TPA: hypothetical protein VFT27_14295 [Actinomycetota bacterium]|nr:hypothetical protein [Actinomycetota bacterium]
MTETRLRDALEREGRRVSLAPGAAERMFERRDRRDRRSRIAAIVESAALVVGVLAIVLATLPGRDHERQVVMGPAAVAGTYGTRLLDQDPDVARLALAGRYELRLSSDGSLIMLSPPDVDMPGPPIAFTVTGARFTTDLLVGQGCDAPGTYRWSRDAGSLTLTPLDEPCEVRSTILATQPWLETSPPVSTDALQGQWRATFTCDEMVATVETAPVSRHDEAIWRRANAEAFGSPDPEDPCAGSPPEPTYTLRFAGDRLQIFDNGPAEGFDGHYRLDGDILTIRDPRSRNINGAYRLQVRVGEGTLTFTLIERGATDPWFLSTWQVAPFESID